MASSLLTGDRRWASTRKTGMTVLGKVPKPINLPSQRLENHGLDPNVEIVPKGTLTWGSRASAAPNAWSSSTLLSPKADGSASSPSYASGRLSSGGSGTRPSTAGSDRSVDLNSSSWGPNSRPSSASGVLSSNQASMNESRPRSAETRPGSSQLSRFAEHSVEGTVAWGPSKTVEKLGAASSKGNVFTLSSGDFPTLGSEKNSESHSQRGHSSQGRPASASSSDATPKERLESPLSGGGNVDLCMDQGNFDALKADKYSYVGADATPNANWHRESQPALPQPVLMKPHQLDSWNGPPIHSSDGVWYRGGVTGGPYRPAGPPGSFPSEPFAYYPPQFPPHSEAIQRAGAGPGGHIKIGESYRPHLPPNSFMVPSHPVFPARPGVYQTPMPYDGYYGPPQASFCNSSEREAPFVGAPSQPGIYNRFPNQNGNLNLGHFQTRPGGCDPVMAKEQKESDRAQSTHLVQYKVLTKQHDGWEDNNSKGKGELSAISTPPHIDRRDKSGGTSHEEGWQTNSRKNEPRKFEKSARDQEAITQITSDHQGNSSGAVIVNSEESSKRTADGILMKKPETAASTACYQQQHPVIKKNATLIEKIEGLNSKVRSSDGHGDVGAFSRSEEKRKLSKVVNTKPEHSTNVDHSNDVMADNAPASGMVISVSPEVNASNVDNNPKSSSGGKVVSSLAELQVIAVSKSESSKVGEIAQSQVHRRTNTTRSRVDHNAKTRPSNQVEDGWTKESRNRESLAMVSVKNAGVGSPSCHSCEEATVEVHHAVISESCSSPLDSDEYRAQRAKMKEIATNRAKQLQKEEEERTREQKAKALAKLEELNKRSSAQGVKQKSNDVSPPTEATQQTPDSGLGTAHRTNENVEEPVGVSAGKSDAVVQPNRNVMENPELSVNLPLSTASHTARTVTQDSATSHDQSLSVQQVINTPKAIPLKSTSHSHDSSVPKNKQMGYRRRNMSQEKSIADKTVTVGNMEGRKSPAEVTELASSFDALPHNEEFSVQHKKKNYRNPRNKNKLYEAPVSSTIPTLAHSKEIIEEGVSENGQTLHSASLVETAPVSAQSSADVVVNQGSTDTSFNQVLSTPTEEAHGRVGNQWKPQPHRRSARNQTGPRTADKFHCNEAVMWAPVGSNKNEQSEEASQNIASETSHLSSGKNENDMHNSMKTKRAEMERYVPKPVAKELSQQENSRQPSSSISQPASVDIMSGKPDSDSKILDRSRPDGPADGRTEAFVADTRTGEDSKPNRRGKTQASWRQRNVTESPSILQSFSEGPVSSDYANLVQNPSDQLQQSNLHSLSEKQIISDGWNSKNDVLVPPEPVILHAAVKDQTVTSRQRRQQLKGQRGAVSHYAPTDNKDFQRGKDEKNHVQSTAVDINEFEVSNAPRPENKNSGESIKSHWKPKSQAHSQNQKQVNIGNEGQKLASYGGRSDKEFSSKGLENNPHDKDVNALTQKAGASETTNESLQEPKGETKVEEVHPTKEQVNAPNQGLPSNVDPPVENVNGRHENRVSSAPRRHGQHNGRFNRGRDAYHRGRDFGLDAGKQTHYMSGDKRKNSSHFEYQPVGSHSKPSDSSPSSNVVEEKKDLQSPGPRFRERGQYHPRRGGHYVGRVSDASVCVGDSCNSEE